MTLLRFNPARGFESISRRMGEFMNELDKGISFEMGGFTPRADITEDELNIFFHLELPGMCKECVKISVNEDRILTIKGEKKRVELSEDKNYIRNERVFGEFSRSFVLPENIDYEKIAAKFENGVLELAIPKKEPEKPKEINIDIA